MRKDMDTYHALSGRTPKAYNASVLAKEDSVREDQTTVYMGTCGSPEQPGCNHPKFQDRMVGHSIHRVEEE